MDIQTGFRDYNRENGLPLSSWSSRRRAQLSVFQAGSAVSATFSATVWTSIVPVPSGLSDFGCRPNDTPAQHTMRAPVTSPEHGGQVNKNDGLELAMAFQDSQL